jgi:hypothetical protein
MVCGLMVLSSLSTNAQTAVMRWNSVHQQITSFGASSSNSSAFNFMKLSETDKVDLCDLFFSQEKGIGLIMLRNELYSFKIVDVKDSLDWSRDEEQIWLMSDAKKRGADYFWSAS